MNHAAIYSYNICMHWCRRIIVPDIRSFGTRVHVTNIGSVHRYHFVRSSSKWVRRREETLQAFRNTCKIVITLRFTFQTIRHESWPAGCVQDQVTPWNAFRKCSRLSRIDSWIMLPYIPTVYVCIDAEESLSLTYVPSPHGYTWQISDPRTDTISYAWAANEFGSARELSRLSEILARL